MQLLQGIRCRKVTISIVCHQKPRSLQPNQIYGNLVTNIPKSCQNLRISSKTKRQANFKDFKRFGAFKGFIEQKNVVSTRSCVNWALYGTRGPLKRIITQICNK
jgi:hypothetical protein